MLCSNHFNRRHMYILLDVFVMTKSLFNIYQFSIQLELLVKYLPFFSETHLTLYYCSPGYSWTAESGL